MVLSLSKASPVPGQIPSHFTKKDGGDTLYQWPCPAPPTPIPKSFSLPSLTGYL